jgi:hypothetical protein
MQPANKVTFDQETNGGKKVKVSIPQYYQTAYNLRLKFPFLPCLGVRGREGIMYFPAEVCNVVPGKRYGGKVIPRHELTIHWNKRECQSERPCYLFLQLSQVERGPNDCDDQIDSYPPSGAIPKDQGTSLNVEFP